MTYREALVEAARRADWRQVELNGGPPCFHLEADGRFCMRAKRWAGHADEPPASHEFKPLHEVFSEDVLPW